MTALSKALALAIGSAIVYTVVSKIAEKFEAQPTQDDIDELTDEVMDEFEDEFDDDIIENVFYRIRKGFETYMAAQTCIIKERISICKEVLNNAQNRFTLGIMVLATGVGIGGGLIASACIKLPE